MPSRQVAGSLLQTAAEWNVALVLISNPLPSFFHEATVGAQSSPDPCPGGASNLSSEIDKVRGRAEQLTCQGGLQEHRTGWQLGGKSENSSQRAGECSGRKSGCFRNCRCFQICHMCMCVEGGASPRDRVTSCPALLGTRAGFGGG